MDFDGIKPGNLDGALRRLGEAIDDISDLRLRHRGRESVAAVAMIECHLFALRLNRRRPHRGVAKAIALADGAGMHHLSDRERAMRLDAADDRLPGIGLRFVSHAGLKDIALRERLIGVNAFGDHRPEAALREALVVAGHRLGRPSILSRGDPRHRRDGQAVHDGMAVYNDRREKRAGINVHGPDLQSDKTRRAQLKSEGSLAARR
jgi:hypothetical protein